MMAARCASVMLRQCTISAIVRPQPVQFARSRSSEQRLRQGLASVAVIT
jgi:hypothetical protein